MSDGTPTFYTVEITGGGPGEFTFKRQIAERKLAQILNVILESGVDPVMGQDSPVHSEGGSGDADTDPTSDTVRDEQSKKAIAEFMSEISPGNNYERLAGIALYHRDILGKGTVHQNDFPKWFERAGRSVPANLSRDIKKTVSKGLIAESRSEVGHFYPTNKAEQRLLGDDE